MRKLLAIGYLALMFLTQSWAQNCNIFFDDFSDATRWTQVGTDVTVNNDRGEFQNYAPNGMQKRIYQEIGVPLDNYYYWQCNVDFHVSSVFSNGAVGHNPISLTETKEEPFSDCTDIPCSGYPVGTQDMISITYVTSSPYSNDRSLYIYARDGETSTEYRSTGIPAQAINTSYYLSLFRTSSSSLVLSVFSDVDRTTQVPGSPIVFDIPESIESLNFVQVSNVARGNSNRKLNGWVDNICIYQNKNQAIPFLHSSVSVNNERNSMIIFPNPTQGKLKVRVEKPILNANIYIYNSTGNLVYEQNNVDLKEKPDLIDISHFNTGMYILSIKSENKTFNKKIIKN